jgi:hypothetical protein
MRAEVVNRCTHSIAFHWDVSKISRMVLMAYARLLCFSISVHLHDAFELR